MVENFEPIAWAEELIEPARAVDHPRLAHAVCDGIDVLDGRTDRGRLSATARPGLVLLGSGHYEVPFGFEGLLSGVYLVIGQPERTVELCRCSAGTRSRHARIHQDGPGHRAENGRFR